MVRIACCGQWGVMKLLKQRHDLTDVYLTKITLRADWKMVDGRVDGWRDGFEQTSAGVGGRGQRHGAGAGGPVGGDSSPGEEMVRGLGGGQRRADLRDCSQGKMRILKTS